MDAKPLDVPKPQETIYPYPTPLHTLPSPPQKGVGDTGDNLICFDAKSYENASKNEADQIRFIKDAMWRLRRYCLDLATDPKICE